MSFFFKYKYCTLIKYIHLFKNAKYLISLIRSDIAIVGFPRSGNSFLHGLIKAKNPQLRVFSHLHSPVIVNLAKLANVPSIIIIRDPLEACASYSVFKDCDLNTSLRLYKSFYSVINFQGEVIIISEIMFKDPITVLDFIFKTYGFEEFEKDSSLLIERAKVIVDQGSRDAKKNSTLHHGLPNEFKSKLKSKLKNKTKNKKYYSAYEKSLEIYGKFKANYRG